MDEKINNTYTVYCHTNMINNKKYIGITKNLLIRRWKKGGSGYKGQVFFNAIQKYGWDNFEHKIIAENLSKEEARKMEIELISTLHTLIGENGYNVGRGGEYSNPIILPVYQFDYHGNLINEYESATEAANAVKAKNSSGISYQCAHPDKKKYAHGYVWRYKKDVPDLNEFKNNFDSSPYELYEPIYQFDLNNNLISSYKSIIDASKTNPQFLTHNIYLNCKGEQATAFGYLWKFQKDVPDIEEFRRTNIIKINYESQINEPVIQLDFHGNIIKEYSSVKEAGDLNNCSCTCIDKVCTGLHSSFADSLWVYKKDYTGNEIYHNNRIRSVLQFDLQGNYINKFISATEAGESLGVGRGNDINGVCRGEHAVAHGFIWKYEDEYDGQKIKLSPSRKAILRFDIDGNFIDRYENCTEAAKAVGLKESSINGACTKNARTFRTDNIWIYENEYSDELLNERININTILQFDLKGNFIARYRNPTFAAKKLNYSSGNIYAACNGKYEKCYGYIWMYESDYKNGKRPNIPISWVVYQYDLNGNFIQQYKNVPEAAKAVGVVNSSIRNVCNGTKKTCKGFKWKYEKDVLKE